ncbi:MAG: hypothetical protein L6243_07000 [Candidatus Altiarchaeales archaeon]|nr:hypothetical protein [Candidatus Altiarchaeota archaeon]MCG2783318.1 hypothetical protein [Candidatus Altiarchaeales archaeon]
MRIKNIFIVGIISFTIFCFINSANAAAPNITNATLDYNTGVLIITGTDFVNILDGTRFHLNDATGTDDVTLTTAEGNVTNTTALTFTLTEAHRVATLAISGVPGGNGGAVVLDVDSNAVDDGTNPNSVDDNNSVTETADTTAPTLSSWGLDLNARTLTLVGSETLDASTLAVTGITIQDAATATTSYTLTDSATSSGDNISIVINLSTTDFNAITANTGLATSQTNSHLTITSAAIDDMAGNDIAAIADGAGMQASAYTQVIVITITSPSEGEITYDITPTLSVTVTPAAELWYNLDDEPVDYILCSSCTSATVTLAEENQDDHTTQYTKLLMHLNGDASDDSGYGNDGHIYGTSFVSARFSQGLDFDGHDDYVEIQDSGSLDITNEITMEAWVKHSTDDFKTWETIIAKGDNSYRLHFYREYETFDMSLTIGGKPYNLDSSTKPVTGEWYHVAGTYDGSEMRIYINGELKDTMNASGDIDTVGYDLWFGDNSEVSGRNLNGTLDEVRILDEALTGDEIRADYGLDNGSHTVVVYARVGETVESVARNFNVEVITEDRVIELEYNETASSPVAALVSVPKRLNQSSKDDVFGTSHIVIFYNATRPDAEGGQWQSAGMIEPCYGYWVLPAVDDTIILHYKPFIYTDMPPDINVYEGWSLIGHTSTQAMDADEALVSVDGRYTMALSYTGSSWDVFIPGADNSGAGRFSQMEPDKGYWVYMLENSTYTAISM